MSLYKRGGVYHYDFTVFGRRYRGSTHKSDIAAARRFERDLIGKTEQGLEPKIIRKIPALHEAAERFLAETCEKAGLSPKAWHEPGTELFGFTVELFSDPGLVKAYSSST